MLRARFVAVAFGLAFAATAAPAVGAAAYPLFNPVPEGKLRPLCSDNPGFGVPPCIIDAGHFMIEWTAVTATFDTSGGVRASNYAIGDVLLRIGLNRTLESYVSWTPLSVTGVKTGGLKHTERATGDVGMGLKQSLRNPDGEGFSVAVAPGVTIPTDGRRVSGRLALPVSQSLGTALTLGFTPELDLLPSTDGGTHLGGSAALALTYGSGSLSVTSEIDFAEDRDPRGTLHFATANFSITWQPPHNDHLNFNIGADFGLNAATPDVQVYCGLSRRF